MRRTMTQFRTVMLAEVDRWEALTRFSGETKTFGGMTTEDTLNSAREIAQICASLIMLLNRSPDMKTFLKELKWRKDRVVKEIADDGLSVSVGTTLFGQAKRRYMTCQKARAYAYSIALSKTDDSIPEPSYEDTMKLIDTAKNYTYARLQEAGKEERKATDGEAHIRDKARRWIRLHPDNDNPPEELRQVVKEIRGYRKSNKKC